MVAQLYGLFVLVWRVLTYTPVSGWFSLGQVIVLAVALGLALDLLHRLAGLGDD